MVHYLGNILEEILSFGPCHNTLFQRKNSVKHPYLENKGLNGINYFSGFISIMNLTNEENRTLSREYQSMRFFRQLYVVCISHNNGFLKNIFVQIFKNISLTNIEDFIKINTPFIACMFKTQRGNLCQ